MRILLVGGSELMAWVVRRLVPAGVEVQKTETLEEARAVFRTRAPDAAIFGVSPSRRPWSALARFCREHRPQIPFIYYSRVFDEASKKGLVDGQNASALSTPPPVPDLQEKIAQLIEDARCGEPDPDPDSST